MRARNEGFTVGIFQQQSNNQRVSPGSRAFTNTECCSTSTATNGAAPVSTPANAEALLLGIDAVSIVANRDGSCASSAGSANVLGKTSFAVAGSPDYTIASSFDVLNLLYFGLHNGTGGSAANSYDCGSPQRRALVSPGRIYSGPTARAATGFARRGSRTPGAAETSPPRLRRLWTS